MVTQVCAACALLCAPGSGSVCNCDTWLGEFAFFTPPIRRGGSSLEGHHQDNVSVTYFDEVRADWGALQKKREGLRISLKRLAWVKPGKDTDKEPKKSKRSVVAEQNLLGTVQAKFDLKSPQSAAKAWSLVKCPNEHAKLHEMTKPQALVSIKSSASAKSYKGLTELALAYFA